jgi:transposase
MFYQMTRLLLSCPMTTGYPDSIAPKHTSWLNQIEIWFSILVRKLLKRASFSSIDDLRQRILNFVEYFNLTMAKPFKWTYTGRPLTA